MAKKRIAKKIQIKTLPFYSWLLRYHTFCKLADNTSTQRHLLQQEKSFPVAKHAGAIWSVRKVSPVKLAMEIQLDVPALRVTVYRVSTGQAQLGTECDQGLTLEARLGKPVSAPNYARKEDLQYLYVSKLNRSQNLCCDPSNLAAYPGCIGDNIRI